MKVASVFAISAVVGAKPVDPNLICAHGLDDWKPRLSDEPQRKECSAGCSPTICKKKMHEHPKLSINECYTPSQLNHDGSVRDDEDPRGCNFGSDDNTCAFEDGTTRCVYSDLGPAPAPAPLKPKKVVISYFKPGKSAPQGLAADPQEDLPGCQDPTEYRLLVNRKDELVFIGMSDEKDGKKSQPCNSIYRENYPDADNMMAWSYSEKALFSHDKGEKVCLKLDSRGEPDDNHWYLDANLSPGTDCTSDNDPADGDKQHGLWNFKYLDLDDEMLCMQEVPEHCLKDGYKGFEKTKCLEAARKSSGTCSKNWQWRFLVDKDLSAQQEPLTSSSMRVTCKGDGGCLETIGSFSCATAAGCLLSPSQEACEAKKGGGEWCAADVKPLDPDLLCAGGHDDWKPRLANESQRTECSAGCSPTICEKKMQQHPKLSINKCYTRSQIMPDGSVRGDPQGCNFGSDDNTCAFEDGTNRCVYADLGGPVMTV